MPGGSHPRSQESRAAREMRRDRLIQAAVIVERGPSNNEPVVGDVLAHGVLDQPALSHARGRDRLVQPSSGIGGQTHVERSRRLRHIHVSKRRRACGSSPRPPR